MMNFKNHLLIAMPTLNDSLFKQAVIYICEHSETGAMGLIINKPANNLTIAELLDKLAITETEQNKKIALDKPVFIGGPLGEERGFILHSPKEHDEVMGLLISNDIALTTSKELLSTIGTTEQPQNMLIALGYSSWAAGQLEQEIIDNVWLTVEADPAIIFNTPISQRWSLAGKKLGINMYNLASVTGQA